MSSEPIVQTTLLLLKPDAVQRSLVGEILSRIERKGLQLIGLKFVHLTAKEAEAHYAEHCTRPDFSALVGFMTSGPAVAVAVNGKNSIAVCRKMIGATNGTNAEPGTIRGDYGSSRLLNLIHASDSQQSADREIRAFFHSSELFQPKRVIDPLIYDGIDFI